MADIGIEAATSLILLQRFVILMKYGCSRADLVGSQVRRPS